MLKVKNRKKIVLSILFAFFCVFLSTSVLFSSSILNQTVFADNGQEGTFEGDASGNDYTQSNEEEDGGSDTMQEETLSDSEMLNTGKDTKLKFLDMNVPAGTEITQKIPSRFKWTFPALDAYSQYGETGRSGSQDADRYANNSNNQPVVAKYGYNISATHDVFGQKIQDHEIYQQVVTKSGYSMWNHFGGGWIPASTKTFQKIMFDALGANDWDAVRSATLQGIKDRTSNFNMTATCWVDGDSVTSSCFKAQNNLVFAGLSNGNSVYNNASARDCPVDVSGGLTNGSYSIKKGFRYAYFPFSNAQLSNTSALDKSYNFGSKWIVRSDGSTERMYNGTTYSKDTYLNLKKADNYYEDQKHPFVNAKFRLVKGSELGNARSVLFKEFQSNGTSTSLSSGYANVAFLHGVDENFSNASDSSDEFKSQYSGYSISIPKTITYNNETYNVVVADAAFKNNKKLLGAYFADFGDSFLKDARGMNGRNDYQDRETDNNMYFGFKESQGNGVPTTSSAYSSNTTANAGSGSAAYAVSVMCYDPQGLVCNRNDNSSGKYIVAPIGKNAFYGCGALQYLVLPKNIEKIPNGMLAYTALTYFNIPKSVITIDYFVLASVSNLSAINIGYDTSNPDEVALQYWNCKYNNNAMLNYTPITTCSNVSSLTLARDRDGTPTLTSEGKDCFGVSNGLLYKYKWSETYDKKVPRELCYATNYLVSAEYSKETFSYLDVNSRPSQYKNDTNQYIDCGTSVSPYGLGGELKTTINDTSRIGNLFKYFSRTRDRVFEAKARQWTSGQINGEYINVNDYDRIDYYYPTYEISNAGDLEMVLRVWANKKTRNIYYSKFGEGKANTPDNPTAQTVITNKIGNKTYTYSNTFEQWLTLSDPNYSSGSGCPNEPIVLVNKNLSKQDGSNKYYYPEKIISNFSGGDMVDSQLRAKKTYVDVYIPETVVEVYPSAFYTTAGLRNVFIPTTLNLLGANNFYYTEFSQLMGNATMQSVRFYDPTAQGNNKQPWSWIADQNKQYFFLSDRNPGRKNYNLNNTSIKFIFPMGQTATNNYLLNAATDSNKFFSLSNGMAFDNFGNGALVGTDGTRDKIQYNGSDFTSYTSSLVKSSNEDNIGFLQNVLDNLVAVYYQNTFKYDFNTDTTNVQKYTDSDFETMSDSERTRRQSAGSGAAVDSNDQTKNYVVGEQATANTAGLYSSGEWVDAGQTQAYMEVNASSVSPEQPVNRSYYFLIDSSGSMYGYMPQNPKTSAHETAADSLTTNSSKFTKNLVAWTFIRTYSNFLIDHAGDNTATDIVSNDGDPSNDFYLKSYLGIRAFRDVYNQGSAADYSARTNKSTVMDEYADRFKWFWQQVCREYSAKYPIIDNTINEIAPNVVFESSSSSESDWSKTATFNPDATDTKKGGAYTETPDSDYCCMANMNPRATNGSLLLGADRENARNDLKAIIMKYIQYCCGSVGGESYYAGPIRETINGLTKDTVYNKVASQYCIKRSSSDTSNPQYVVTTETVKPMVILIGDGEDTQHTQDPSETCDSFKGTIFGGRPNANVTVDPKITAAREAEVRSKLDFSGLLVSNGEPGSEEKTFQFKIFEALCGKGNFVIISSGDSINNAISAVSAFSYGKYYVDVDIDADKFDVQFAGVMIGGTDNMVESSGSNATHYPNIPSALSSNAFNAEKETYAERMRVAGSTNITSTDDLAALTNLHRKYISLGDSSVTTNANTTRYRICFNMLPNMNRINKLVFLLKLKDEKTTGDIYPTTSETSMNSAFFNREISINKLKLNRSSVKISKISKNGQKKLPDAEFTTKYKNTSTNLEFNEIQSGVNGSYLRAIDGKTKLGFNSAAKAWVRASNSGNNIIKTGANGEAECYGYFGDAPASPNDKVVFTETTPPAGYKASAAVDVPINNTSATPVTDPYKNGQITLYKVVDITGAGIDTKYINNSTSDNYKNCLNLISGLSWDFTNLKTVDGASLKTDSDQTLNKIVVAKDSSSKKWYAYWKSSGGTNLKTVPINWKIETEEVNGKVFLVFSTPMCSENDSAVKSYTVTETVPSTSIFNDRKSYTRAGSYTDGQDHNVSSIINAVNGNNGTLANPNNPSINVNISDLNITDSHVIFRNYLPSVVDVGLTKQNDGVKLENDSTFSGAVRFKFEGTIGDNVKVSGSLTPGNSSPYPLNNYTLKDYTYYAPQAFSLIPGQYTFSEEISYPTLSNVVPFADVKSTVVQKSSISNNDITSTLDGLKPTLVPSNPVSNNTEVSTSLININSSNKTNIIFRNIRANSILIHKESDDGVIEGFTFKLTSSTGETTTATTNSAGIARFDNVPVFSSGNTNAKYTIEEINVPARYGTPTFSYDRSTVSSSNGVLSDVSLNMRQNILPSNLSEDNNVLNVYCENPSKKVNVQIKKIVKDGVVSAKGIGFTITGFTLKGAVPYQLATNTNSPKEGNDNVSYTDSISLPIYDSDGRPIVYCVDENAADMANFTNTTFTSSNIQNFNRLSFTLENVGDSTVIVCTNERSNSLEIVKQDEDGHDLINHAGEITFSIRNNQNKLCYFKKIDNEYVFSGFSSGSGLVRNLPIDNLGKIKVKGLETKQYTVNENSSNYILGNYNGIAPSQTITITLEGPNRLTFKNTLKKQTILLTKFAEDVSQTNELETYIKGTTFSITGTTASGNTYSRTITINDTDKQKTSANSKIGLYEEFELPYGSYTIEETSVASLRYALNRAQYKIDAKKPNPSISNGLTTGKKTPTFIVDDDFSDKEIIFLNRPKQFNITVYKMVVGLDENLQQEAVARKVAANTQFRLTADSASTLYSSKLSSTGDWKYVKSYVPDETSKLNGAVFSYTFKNVNCTKSANGAQIEEISTGPYTTLDNGCVYVDAGDYSTWEDDAWETDATDGLFYYDLPDKYIGKKINFSISPDGTVVASGSTARRTTSVTFVNRVLPAKVRIVKSDDISNGFDNTYSTITFKNSLLTRLNNTKFTIEYNSPSTTSGVATTELTLSASDADSWSVGKQLIPATSKYKYYIYRDVVIPYKSKSITVSERNLGYAYTRPKRQVYATPSTMTDQTIYDLSLSSLYQSASITINNANTYNNNPMFVFDNIHKDQTVYISKAIAGIDKSNSDTLLSTLSRSGGKVTLRIRSAYNPELYEDFVFDSSHINKIDTDDTLEIYEDCPPFDSGNENLSVLSYETSLPPGTYTIEEILPNDTIYERSNTYPKVAQNAYTSELYEPFGLNQQSNLNKKTFVIGADDDLDYNEVCVVNKLNTNKITLSKISNISFSTLGNNPVKKLFKDLRFNFTNTSTGATKIVNASDSSWSVETTSDGKYKYITCNIELERGTYTVTEEYLPGTKSSDMIFGSLNENASVGKSLGSVSLSDPLYDPGNSISFDTETDSNIVFKNECKESRITLLKAADNINANASEQQVRTLFNGVSFKITDGAGSERTEAIDSTWSFIKGNNSCYLTKSITIYPGYCSFEEMYNGDIYDLTKTYVSCAEALSPSAYDTYITGLTHGSGQNATSISKGISNKDHTVMFLNSPKTISLRLYKTASDILSTNTAAYAFNRLSGVKIRLTNLTSGEVVSQTTIPATTGSGWTSNRTTTYRYVRPSSSLSIPAGLYLVEEVEGNSNYDVGYALHYTKGCNDNIIRNAKTGSSFMINTSDCYGDTDLNHTGVVSVGFHNQQATKTICLQKAVVSPTSSTNKAIVSEDALRKLFCKDYEPSGRYWYDLGDNEYRVAFEIRGQSIVNGILQNDDVLIDTIPVDRTWEYKQNSSGNKGMLYKEVTLDSVETLLYDKIYVKEVYSDIWVDTLPFDTNKTYNMTSGEEADSDNSILKNFTSLVSLVNNYNAIDVFARMNRDTVSIGDTSHKVDFDPLLRKNFAHYAFVNTIRNDTTMTIIKSADDFCSKNNSIMLDDAKGTEYVKNRLKGIGFTVTNEWTGESTTINYSANNVINSAGSWKYMAYEKTNMPFGEYTITEKMTTAAKKRYDPDNIWVSPYGGSWTNPHVFDEDSMRSYFVTKGDGVKSNTISHVATRLSDEVGGIGPVFINNPKLPQVTVYKVVDGIKDNITESEFRSLVNGTKINFDWADYEIDNTWEFVEDYYCKPLNKNVPAVCKTFDNVSYDVEFKEKAVTKYLDLSLAKYYVDNATSLSPQTSDNMSINVMDGNPEHSITFVNNIKMKTFKLCKTATDVYSHTSNDTVKDLFDGIQFKIENPYTETQYLTMNKDDFTTNTSDTSKWIIKVCRQYKYVYKTISVPVFSTISEIVNENYDQTLVTTTTTTDVDDDYTATGFETLFKSYTNGSQLADKLVVTNTATNDSLYVFCNCPYESEYTLYKSVKGNLTEDMIREITNGLEIKLKDNTNVNKFEYSFIIGDDWQYVGVQNSAVGTVTTLKKVVTMRNGTYQVCESCSDSFDMDKTIILKNRTNTADSNKIKPIAIGTDYVGSPKSSPILLPRATLNDNVDICYVVNTPVSNGKLRIIKSSTSLHAGVNNDNAKREFIGLTFKIKIKSEFEDTVVKTITIEDTNESFNAWGIGYSGNYKYIYFDITDLPYGLYDVEEDSSSLTRHSEAYNSKEIADIGTDRMTPGYVVSDCVARKDSPDNAVFFNVSKQTRIMISKVVAGTYSREDAFKLMSGLSFNITALSDPSYLKTVTIPDINDPSASQWMHENKTLTSGCVTRLYTYVNVPAGMVTVSEVLTNKFDPNGIVTVADVRDNVPPNLLSRSKSNMVSVSINYSYPNEDALADSVRSYFLFLNTLANKDVVLYKLANDTAASDDVSEEILHQKFDGISFNIRDSLNTDPNTVSSTNLAINSDWEYMQEGESDFGFGILYKTISVPVGDYVVTETLQSNSDYDPDEIYFANSLTDILNKNSRTHVNGTNKATISTLNNQDELYFYNTTGIKEITLTKVVPGVRREDDLRTICNGLKFNIIDVKDVFASNTISVDTKWSFSTDTANDYGMLSFKTTIRPGTYVVGETLANRAKATFDTDKTQVSLDINKFINNTAERATEIRINSSQIRNNGTIFFLNERKTIPVTLVKAMRGATYATTKEDLFNAVKNTEFEVVNLYNNTVVFDGKIDASWSEFNYNQTSSFATLSKTIYLPKGRYRLTEKIGDEANLKYFKTENGGSSQHASAAGFSLFVHNLHTNPKAGRTVDFSTLTDTSYHVGFLNSPGNVKVRVEKIVRAYGDFVNGSAGSMSIDNFKQIVNGVQFKVTCKTLLQQETVLNRTINTSSTSDKWTFEEKMINGNRYCVAYQDVGVPLGTVSIEEIIPSNNEALDPNNVVYGSNESVVARSTTASTCTKHTLDVGLTHNADARYSFWKNNLKQVALYVKKTANNFTNNTSQQTMINNLNGISFKLEGTSPYYGNVSRTFTIDKNSESCLNAIGLDRDNNAIYFAFNIPYGTTCSVEEFIGSNNVYSLLHSTVSSTSFEDAKQKSESGTTRHENKISNLSPTPSNPVVVYFYNQQKEKPDFEIKFEKMVNGVPPTTPTNISYATDYSTTIKVVVKNNSEETDGIDLPINIGMIPLNGTNWQKFNLNGGPAAVSLAPGESKTLTYTGIDKFQDGSTIKSFLDSYGSGLHTLRAEINYNNRTSEKVSTNNSDFTVVDSKDWSANSVGIHSSDGGSTPTVENGSIIKVSPTFTYMRSCNMGTNKAKLAEGEFDAFDKTALIQEKGVDPDLKESYVVKGKDAYLQFYFRYAGTSTDILMSTPDGDEDGKVYLKDIDLSLLNNKKEYAGPVGQNEQGEYVLSSKALIRAENIRLQLPTDLPADQLDKNHTITVAIRFGDRTDETNINNNTKAQTIKVVENIKLVVQKVSPNSAYYEDTDVITTFKVINESSKEFIGTNDFKLAFTVVDSSTGTTIASSEEGVGLDDARSIEPEIVVPGNSLNYYYWKWHVPAGIQGHKLLCTATISGNRKANNVYFEGKRKNENGLYDQDTLTKVVASVPISNTPDTSYTGSSKEQLKQILEDSSSKTNKTLIESFLTRLASEYESIVLYGDKTDMANPDTGLFDEDSIHNHRVDTLNSNNAGGEDDQNYYYQNTAVWEEWTYNNTTSSFEKLTYNAYLNPSNSIDVSTADSNIVANGDYKSGYGFGIKAYASIGSDTGSAPIEDSMYTCTQVASALFPENLFSGVIGKYETMYKKNPSLKPGTSNRFVLKNSETAKEYAGKNIHFSPIWYPNGSYPVGVEFSQCWTPAGVLSLQTVNNSLEVKGSIYDDWYTRQ